MSFLSGQFRSLGRSIGNSIRAEVRGIQSHALQSARNLVTNTVGNALRGASHRLLNRGRSALGIGKVSVGKNSRSSPFGL